MRDISSWISHRASWSPEKTAIRFAGRETDYRELDQRINTIAGALAHNLNIQKGDRVAHLGYNSDELIVLLFACARLGALLVPLNWRLAPPEHAWILNNCTPKAILVEDDFITHVESIADALPADLKLIAYGEAAFPWHSYKELRSNKNNIDYSGNLQDAVMIVYTSGTTGQPKGSVLTQNALFYNALNSIAAHDMRSDDHILTVLPMFHVGGMNIQTTPALYVGATVTLHDRFEPTNFLTSVATEKPTMTLLVPAAMQAVSSHQGWEQTDLSSLKLLGTGSSTVPDALIRPWQRRGIPVTQVYGLTESTPVAICLSVADSLRSTGSCGKAAVHCEAKIVRDDGSEAAAAEKGEILLRGPNILREYWQDPGNTDAAFSDGWFHTGDIGHLDEEGFFYVDDRKKDVVISGGENIYPAELENILAECEDLSEWAVVGENDPRWVEIPVACVVPKEGRKIAADSILKLFQGRLARYKHPKKVYFFDQLPRTALGKVQKFELKAMLVRR
jgi:fatty-acyl-CoA synthase